MAKDPSFLFYPSDWNTPNTYDNNYASPPDKSGVYLIVLPTINEQQQKLDYKILYVGSAKNLKARYERHEVKRLLTEVYGYIQFYFRMEDNYREVEKKLIRQIQPKFNKQWL